MDKEALRELAADLAMNHEFCPKDVILKASDALLNLLAEIQSLTEERIAWRTTAENAGAELVNARKQMEAQKDEWLSWEAKRARLEAAEAELKAIKEAEPVGEAGRMPGTDGFTMACFHADRVPFGTPLYTLQGESK